MGLSSWQVQRFCGGFDLPTGASNPISGTRSGENRWLILKSTHRVLPMFESPGKKLETRLDLTLWIIESLVGNP